MDTRTLFVPLLCLAVQTTGVECREPGEDTLLSWRPVLEWLRSGRDRMSADLQDAHAKLLARARAAGEEELVDRLSPEPPRPRPVGYGILPEILDDEPVEPREPRETTYSLEGLSHSFPREFRDAAILVGRATYEPELPLGPAVAEFERLRKRMRNLEDHLDYHSSWQLAVLENREFFGHQNRIVELVREMEQVRRDGGEEGRVGKLHAKVLERIASFAPAPDLEIEARPDGTQALRITVWTDIEDEQFLRTFREIVESAFSNCAASREAGFVLDLRLRRISASELYPEGAPGHGEAINATEHRSRFPRKGLILTTGARALTRGKVDASCSVPLR